PTAFREVFGQTGTLELSEAEMALANEAAITKVVVEGQIDQVLNVKSKSALKEFVSLIKGFKLPPDLLKQARKLKLHEPKIIKNVEQLQTVLSSPDWRNMPQLVDTPAPSQIFGQIAHAAGIEAILYRSVKGKKDCLAVFVENFQNSNSFVELEGAIPKATKLARLDSASWQDFAR
ncbi:MAG: RES domain-containing protein, partial [Terriglobia bacterium]